ncbi:SAF domain-containing protein [Phytoactinopolyspora limicola]|uniref:SAF domain-containing protein n=1 Tax=Phytoactinopolyspora limicola TaxID=2715536 RepID=UPI00140DF9A9|nr:SAF domain-containing protein [Phytoactinopolyspora limicola]
MDNGRIHLTRWVRAVGWHRRLLAAGLAAAAAALAIHVISPTPPAGVDVLVAARDLSGGEPIHADDITTVALPPDTLPGGLVGASDVIDRVLAGPVRAGEPITDRRLLGPALLDGWGSDLVAAPVRVTDAGAATLIRTGDRIDLLAAGGEALTGAHVVASDVPVLTVLTTDGGALAEGALLVVGATADQAADLAQAAVTARLSFTIGPG